MSKIDKEFFHKEHSSRNSGLISEIDQEKIRNTVLLIAGCGVGSQIALSAVRMGFEKFILVDGDKVELSNNNRQGYGWRDVGKFKVDALSKKIKAINPHAEIKKYKVFVDTKNAESLVRKCDIVLDVIDPESIIPIIALHRAGRKHNKYIIQPNDLGWGASVHIYSNKSKTIEEMLELDPHTPIEKIDPVIATSNYFKVGLEIMPEYAKAVLNDLLTGKIDHYPQPISAAYILSALSVMAAKRIALDLPVKVVPSFASFDPFDILDPDN